MRLFIARKRSVGAACAAALAIGIAACGSSQPASPNDQVRATFNDFKQAVLSDDYGHACDLMTTKARIGIVAAGQMLGGKSEGGCEGALRSVMRLLDAGERKKLSETTARSVWIHGGTAELRESTGETTRLRRVEGAWLIDYDETSQK